LVFAELEENKRRQAEACPTKKSPGEIPLGF
jgi:hypothetical protein